MNNTAEILRLISNLIRIGTVEEVDVDAVCVRVKSGDNLTGWIHWISTRAGTTKIWNPPTIGEQVVLLSPSGDLAQALVLCSLNSDQHPAPKNSADLYHVVMPDGSSLTYNHVEHQLQLEVLGDTHVHISGATAITIDGDATIAVGGDLSATVTGKTSLKSDGDLKIESSGDINISAAGNANISGTNVNLN
jgi:phage baseplate assembly protein V